MPRNSLAADLVLALIAATLIWVAVCDVRSRRIPNVAVAAILLLCIPWAFVSGTPPLSSLAAAGLALVGGFTLFAFGVLGAGDGKLFAACALLIGLDDLLDLTILTGLAGGALALGGLALRPMRTLATLQVRGFVRSGISVPYGVAIAAATLWVLGRRLLGQPILG